MKKTASYLFQEEVIEYGMIADYRNYTFSPDREKANTAQRYGDLFAFVLPNGSKCLVN
jgi:hypothetical protein